MAALVGVILVIIVWVIVRSGSGGYAKLLQSGIPGRGILLAVSSTSLGSVGVGMYKLQRRSVTIDVEVPGRPPYEVSVTVLIPLNLVRDVLPGATVELRIARSNPNNIAIVGPGVGFNAATLVTQAQINQGAA